MRGTHKDLTLEMALDMTQTPVDVGNEAKQLVISYLVHHCYHQTADSFVGREEHARNGHATNGTATTTTTTNGDVHMDDASEDQDLRAYLEKERAGMEVRRSIRSSILQGNIAQAISLCNSTFPDILSTDPHDPKTDDDTIAMSFKLHCQQFVEYVRRITPSDPTTAMDASTKALLFAQNILQKYPDLDRLNRDRYQRALTDVAGLLAYADPRTSPVAFYLDQSQRDMLALEINSFIMSRSGNARRPCLEDVVRQCAVVHDLLSGADAASVSKVDKTDREKDKKEDKEKEKEATDKAATTTAPVTPIRWSLSTFLGNSSS